MTTDQYKAEFELLHNKYEKRAYSILKKHIRKIISKIPLNNISLYNAKMVVDANFDEKQMQIAYKEMYKSIGLAHGKWVVRNIDKETKDIGLSFFETFFTENLYAWMFQNIGQRIISVNETLAEQITATIIGAFNNEQNLTQIRANIYKLVNSPNFYRWQAMRIARTETTTIANYATLQAGLASKLVMQKEWASIIDTRTRTRPDSYYDHIHMNGAIVDIKDPFNVNGDFLQFPGDAEGEPGDIINCRCTFKLVPKRDINGFLIYKK